MDNCIEYSLLHEDIEFTKELILKEYKTGFDTDFETKERIDKILKSLNLTSFEEAARKFCFFGFVDVDLLSKEYLEYIEKYSRKKISNTLLIRNFMFNAAKTAPFAFAEFCYNTHHFDEEEKLERVNSNVAKIRTEDEIQKMFLNVQNFIELFDSRKEFERIFNTIFKLKTEENKDFSSIIFSQFEDMAALYLFVVRYDMEDIFPVQIERELNINEKELINYLLYKGDEIDYMKANNLSYTDFRHTIFGLYDLFATKNLEETLISALVYQDFHDNCIVYDYFNWRIRAGLHLDNKEKILSEMPEEKRSKAKSLFKAIDEAISDKVFSDKTIKEYLNFVYDIQPYEYFMAGRVDYIANWFKANSLNLTMVSRLQKATLYIEKLKKGELDV